MRPSVYPERVVFHDNPAIVAALKERAGRENVTLAEVLRRAARREVAEAA